jgi:glucose/arabinose dehydrogenase
VVSHGQVWSFPDCYGQGGPPCTGTPAPLAELDPHAAVSGVAVVTGVLSPGSPSSAVVAEWSTGNVLVVPLGGATSSASVLLTGFAKPMPTVVAPSGELLVGDWGTGSIYAIAAS